MAAKRPAHRRGTTGRDWRLFRAKLLASGAPCWRCGTAGWITNAPCDHESHAKLKGCPTHPMYPTVGHLKDLQHGGRPRDPANARPEHFRCNSRAGRASQGRTERRISWDW